MRASKHKRPTLQNVADTVGVTKMTVSRYLRDPKKVSVELQVKIAEAIEALGYIPNRAPEMLANARSHSIGVLLPSLTNQVFAEVVRGIESVIEPLGYQTMLAHYGYSLAAEEARIATLLSYNVDALILTESQHTDRVRKMIATAGVPVVEIMDSAAEPIDQSVGFDNRLAAFEMTRHMIQRGRQHIAYFAARMDMRTQLRMQGYTEAMESQGLTPICLQTTASSSFTLGAQLLRDALEQHPNVDGVFCTNDDLAIGALFECHKQGINVPGRMAVVGFHGHDMAQAMYPPLATVITPRYQMGELAAKALLNRLAGEPAEMVQQALPVEYDFGGSL